GKGKLLAFLIYRLLNRHHESCNSRRTLVEIGRIRRSRFGFALAAFTSTGTQNLKNAEFALDKGPIEENCACYACAEFSRGYIRHLIKAEEILGLRLITLHNLHFYLDLMKRTRAAIANGNFLEFHRHFISGYRV